MAIMRCEMIFLCVSIALYHLYSVYGQGEYRRRDRFGNHHDYPKLAPIEMPDEKRIIHELLHFYQVRGIDGRPVRNSSMPVSLNFSIQLIQIMDLDEKNQILKLSVWDRYLWKDEFLMWDPAQYGGVTNVRIHQDKVWKPDLKLYNYADERVEEHREALLVVEYTGKIVWMPQVIYKSSCAIDISHFPFDEQECKLKFGSWTYDGNKLDVNFLNNITEIDLSEYMSSNAWEIMKVPGKRNVKYYTCCPEPYIDLTFTLRVRRRSAFYNYLLLLPCILLSTLTLVLFWIPPESPAKMALGINIFVAFFLLLVILESSLPSASTVPLLGIYYCFNMVIITLSSFLNVLVVNMAFYGPRGEVPQFLRTLAFEVFAKVFFMNKLAVTDLAPEEQAKTVPENQTRATVNGNHFVGVDAETNWMADGWRDCPREHAKVGGGSGGGVPIVRGGGGVVIVRGGDSVVGVGVPGSGGTRGGGGRSGGSGGDHGGAGGGGMIITRGREPGEGCRGDRGSSSSRGSSLERGQRLCSHHRQVSGDEGNAVAGSGHHHHHHPHHHHRHHHHHHHQHGGGEKVCSGSGKGGGGGGGEGGGGGGGGTYYGSTGEIIGGGDSRSGSGEMRGGEVRTEVRTEVRGSDVRAEVREGRAEVRSGGEVRVRGGGGGRERESRESRESRGGRSSGGGTDSAASGSENLMKKKELIQIERDVKAIRKFVNDSMNRLAESDRKEKLSREWKAVALIFDRLFFFFYVIVISISLMVVPVTLRTGSGE